MYRIHYPTRLGTSIIGATCRQGTQSGRLVLAAPLSSTTSKTLVSNHHHHCLQSFRLPPSSGSHHSIRYFSSSSTPHIENITLDDVDNRTHGTDNVKLENSTSFKPGTTTTTSSSSPMDQVTMASAAEHDDDVADDEEEMEQEDMFVEPYEDFEFRTMEWGGPRRGGRFPEPTRYGDWERKGRCTDF